ncbi:MAG TPA: AAA family ATPase [Streptosporangiaceae bacterium]|jgi:SpoVK/Ycf46/Vps4 family AAA+-type ATPase|nr:AAA family ATPase [Streptosporangiaceae bacterium]
MPPADGSLSAPGQGPVRSTLGRLRRSFDAAPLPIKILIVIACCIICVPFAAFGILAGLIFAPYAVWTGRRDGWATASVGLWGLVLVATQVHGDSLQHYSLLALPVIAALVAHAGALGRWFAPCRTVAWVLLLALLPGIAAFRLIGKGQSLFGPALAWMLAAVVLGWRLAKAWQDSRQNAQMQQIRGGGPGAGVAWKDGQTTRQNRARPANGLAGGGSGQAGQRPGSRPTPGGRPAAGPEGTRVMASGRTGLANAPTTAIGAENAYPVIEQPAITVDEAMAELDEMIGLTAVKDQVRSFAASIEAARRRAMVGIGAEKPMQHFVFLGPPGTGKTAVARIVAKIFYAFGLLDSPAVIEAQRSDLVGEYLGATAIKTNELIDSAIGGVLFIDEAYSLVNEGDGQNDRFGNEAVQALLKRAEDDRDRLVIILAGYERQMEAFLASNPGLTSRFAIRVKFGGYTPAELLQLADLTAARRGEIIDPHARSVLWRMFEEVGRRRLGDELGNGRFVRTLLERAGQARDVRVMGTGFDPAPADLVTLTASDLEHAYTELTSRYRGYDETPTLESALAELDALVGLEPVKRQVHEIAAQLRVARLRDAQGLTSQPPVRHFVFTGPPGTGKTTVARILARIFAALGLLVRPGVVEAHRADLVGDHLGSTAIKTNKLVDSALGGVLFVDEAYSLYNDGYSGGDAFGAEAVATLLKRAEDDRDRLVMVLAGYTDDMTRFLRTNPGLASRFSVRIAFPSYSPDELVRISTIFAAQAGDRFAPDALPVLTQILIGACEQGRIDELGNGRYARSLYERACASRDLRVAQLGESASAAELTTISAGDVEAAHRGISS